MFVIVVVVVVVVAVVVVLGGFACFSGTLPQYIFRKEWILRNAPSRSLRSSSQSRLSSPSVDEHQTKTQFGFRAFSTLPQTL